MLSCLGLQVIPFLVLAVGVDNMFILANTLDTTDASRPLPERIGQALSEAGPSITLAATAGGTSGIAEIHPRCVTSRSHCGVTLCAKVV